MRVRQHFEGGWDGTQANVDFLPVVKRLMETIRMSGVFMPRQLKQRRFHCRWRAPDTSVRTAAGACHQVSGFEFAAAGERRAWSTASAAAWRSAC